MVDLYNNKYDRKILKDLIYSVKLIDILKTQLIDASFAARYILNKKYQFHEDDNLTIYDVLKYQPHIKYENLQKALHDYDSDDDSVDDFETSSNKNCSINILKNSGRKLRDLFIL
jgi:hypothetical protein